MRFWEIPTTQIKRYLSQGLLLESYLDQRSLVDAPDFPRVGAEHAEEARRRGRVMGIDFRILGRFYIQRTFDGDAKLLQVLLSFLCEFTRRDSHDAILVGFDIQDAQHGHRFAGFFLAFNDKVVACIALVRRFPDIRIFAQLFGFPF
ncbi:hypothetical protein [Noviherbaspirillum sp. ST9]|uniref:hypothetical protein n=1 Tax=Noviherbaspirillum sp. ST9 TaxID=3401606 RepID=UPI003B586CD3